MRAANIISSYWLSLFIAFLFAVRYTPLYSFTHAGSIGEIAIAVLIFIVKVLVFFIVFKLIFSLVAYIIRKQVQKQ